MNKYMPTNLTTDIKRIKFLKMTTYDKSKMKQKI